MTAYDYHSAKSGASRGHVGCFFKTPQNKNIFLHPSPGVSSRRALASLVNVAPDVAKKFKGLDFPTFASF